ncbi:hypothetical protein YC2023_110305 [Brassica napus]
MAQPILPTSTQHHIKLLVIPIRMTQYFAFQMQLEKGGQHGRLWVYLQGQGRRYLTSRNTSSLAAEALALRWTIFTAHAKGFSKLCFNTDCQSLLVAITSKDPMADLYGIIQDIEIYL